MRDAPGRPYTSTTQWKAGTVVDSRRRPDQDERPSPDHCVLLHDGPEACLAGLRAFLATGDPGVPVLAVVTPGTYRTISPVIGADAAYQDVTLLGRNPARVIPAIQQFVEGCGPPGPVRVVTEQWWDERELAERVELARHEALTNLAFRGHDVAMVCLYDRRKLPPGVVDDAMSTHPCTVDEGGPHLNPAYADPETVIEMTDHSMEPPPLLAEAFEVKPGGLSALRAVVHDRAAQAGLPNERVGDLVIAANELATNVVSHGEGNGELRMWTDDSWLVCEVADAGRVEDQFAGRRPPRSGDTTGRGLWMVNQLCDLVELRSNPSGTSVRLRFVLPKPAGVASPRG